MGVLRTATLALGVATAFVAALLACGDNLTLSPVDAGLAETGSDGLPDDGADAGVDAPPVPRGSRILGLGLDLGDPSVSEDLQDARDAGVQATSLDVAWDEIEQEDDAGVDGEVLFAPALHVANLFYADPPTSLTLATAALDVGGPRLPPDLVGRPLDDFDVGERFDRITDYALASLPDVDVAALLLATSVDVALGDDEAQWAAFSVFMERAAAHAKSLRPNLAIGFTVTAEGLVAKKALMAKSLAVADVVAVTYVPVDATAKARPISDVSAELAAVVAAADGKPVLIREIGYPSDPACGADEATQAAFIDATFRAWDQHASQIAYLGFSGLGDARQPTVAAEAARAQRSDAPFLAMLGSLGMRTVAGRDKPSLAAFRRAARARGW